VLTFVIRRTLWTVVVMFVITVVVFFIFFKTPGVDPARAIAGRSPTPQQLAEIRVQFGLNRPLYVQYARMMKSIFIDRNLVSYSDQGELVIPEIFSAAPATLSLVFGASLIWIVTAIGMGAAAAKLRGTIYDPILMILALIGISCPVFWLGQVVNLITQGGLHRSVFSWLPALGYTSFATSPVKWFEGLIFPWITLSILYIGLYIRTARAKGLSEQRVLLRHTLRTSMITFVSLFGLDFGALVGGGAILTEVVFGIHGVGFLTYEALINLDLATLMAVVIFGAFFIVLANALVDIGYAWLDPRVRPT
jgi:peptide/nickel transport system permease protein